MDTYFYLIVGIATVASVSFSLITKGILYHTPDTDNELMAYAAAQSDKWRWLSDVHKYSASTRKVSMKEWTIILLSVFQKIFRTKTTDWPYVSMAGLAVSFSTVLIYLITSNYFYSSIGLIIAILYIVSFWPWQVSLYGGHANIANLFFLLSVYSVQMASESILPQFFLLNLGGVFMCLCLFSSPSSHKYSIAIFAALFFTAYRNLLESYNFGAIINIFPANHLLLFDGIVLAVFLLTYIFIQLSYKQVVKKIYLQEAPDFFNKLMSKRDYLSLEHYINHANKKICQLERWVFWILFSLLILTNLIPIQMLLAFMAGFILIFFLLNMPNVQENIAEYFACMLEHKRKTHFKSFIEYFARRGVVVKRNTRGAGLSWIPKMLWTFIPFHSALFIVTFLIGQYRSLITGNVIGNIYLVAITFVSLSPIIWTEITKAPQASRLYSPALITSLLLPAYVISNIALTTYILFIFSSIGILTFAWNLRVLVEDVFPARMAARNLMQAIHRLGIKEIYTYSTSFNNAFLNAIPGIGKSQYLPEKKVVPPPFHIYYIQRLDEVADGWIVIPGTSSKALNATDEIENGDYVKDPVLNHLIETRQIEKIAEVKFKTYGSSIIWVHEDDITSYRALHLRDIGPEDLYRGYAWLIHSSKLKSVLSQ